MDEKAECPTCSKQNATIRAIRQSQEEAAERHALFLDALGRGRDGLGVVSECFGRGVGGGGGAGGGAVE